MKLRDFLILLIIATNDDFRRKSDKFKLNIYKNYKKKDFFLKNNSKKIPYDKYSPETQLSSDIESILKYYDELAVMTDMLEVLENDKNYFCYYLCDEWDDSLYMDGPLYEYLGNLGVDNPSDFTWNTLIEGKLRMTYFEIENEQFYQMIRNKYPNMESISYLINDDEFIPLNELGQNAYYACLKYENGKVSGVLNEYARDSLGSFENILSIILGINSYTQRDIINTLYEGSKYFIYSAEVYDPCNPFYSDDGDYDDDEEEDGDYDDGEEDDDDYDWETERKQCIAEKRKRYEDNCVIVKAIPEFNGKTFVASGVDYSAEKKIKSFLENNGAFLRSSVSGKTNYLIVSPELAGDTKYCAVLGQATKGHTVEVIFYDDFVKYMNGDVVT